LVKVLFISGSVGLGHVGRDIAVANAMRKLKPDIQIEWMAGDPARTALKANGEKLIPETEGFDQGTSAAEASAKDYHINVMDFAKKMVANYDTNAKKVWDAVAKNGYDLVIHDEAYEVYMYPDKHKVDLKPIVSLVDYFGTPGEVHGLKSRLMKWMYNRAWIKSTKVDYGVPVRYIFFGELEDVENKKMGLMLPNARELVSRSNIVFVGYPLSFDLDAVSNREKVRKELGDTDGRTVLCTIGGTTAGKPLLDLCIKSYPLMRSFDPELRMVLALGPHIDISSLKVPEGITLLGYTPELFRHMAASDLVICSGGGTTTLELAALQKPFLYFPLIGHFEQEEVVAKRCERQKTGVRMQFDRTTPEMLAQAVKDNIWRKVEYSGIRFDGVNRAAELIAELI
jgi:UDP-N-acetylglucosamine:LPS N-acetylglucosamine transferase